MFWVAWFLNSKHVTVFIHIWSSFLCSFENINTKSIQLCLWNHLLQVLEINTKKTKIDGSSSPSHYFRQTCDRKFFDPLYSLGDAVTKIHCRVRYKELGWLRSFARTKPIHWTKRTSLLLISNISSNGLTEI